MACAIVKAAMIGALFLACAAHGADVTPIQKVTALLDDLSVKIAKEGEKEAAQYDKFACFCKEQATGKLLAIEKSRDRIKKLKAEQGALNTKITELANAIKKTNQAIAKTKASIEERTEKRNKDHAAYLAELKDITEAIRQTQDSVDTFAGSLGSQKKEWNDETDYKHRSLLQVEHVQVVLKKHPDAAAAVALIQKLTGGSPGLSPETTKQILESLKGLMAKFKAKKAGVESDERVAKDMFDRQILAWNNENKFAAREVAENENVMNAKEADLEDSKEHSDQETKDMNADQDFLDEVTKECETKARLFDRRSSTRANELNAIGEATAALKKGAPPKGAVGVMAELQKPKQSLLQLSRQSNQGVVIERVRSLLEEAGTKTKSKALSTLAIRIQVADDHFVKVRGLIKDLMAKLEADATSEATQKEFCDEGMNKAMKNRDTAKSKIEAASAQVSVLNAEKADLNTEIQDLRDQNAADKKAFNEATELRRGEAENNAETIKLSENAIAGVKIALETLEKFYSGAALAQMQAHKWTPKNADREGKSVADRAPDVFQDSYHGKQAESTGILGILQVCLSDFERVLKQTTKDEADAAADHKKFEEETNTDISKRDKDIKTKEGEVVDIEADLVDERDTLKGQDSLLETSLKALESLKSECIDREGFADRKTARLQEIASLKEAVKILDAWKSTE